MPELSDGYSIVGLSQGNMIGRALIDFCDGAPPVSSHKRPYAYVYVCFYAFILACSILSIPLMFMAVNRLRVLFR